MRLGKFINTLGYVNVEEHLKMTLVSKQRNEYGEEDFIKLETNVSTVCRYYNNKISDICVDGDDVISVFILQ